jgi:PAS domain S-box-containing protein
LVVMDVLKDNGHPSPEADQLRASYQRNPVPTYTWRCTGDDFVLVDCNAAARAITGAPLPELMRTSARTLFGDRPAIIKDMLRCYRLQTSEQRERSFAVSSTGETTHVAVSYVYVSPDRLLVYTEDITARKEAEAALRRSAAELAEQAARLERQANLLELTHEPVFVRDLNAIIQYWNRGAEERYGWTRQEAIGRRSHTMLQTQFPRPVEEVYADLLRDDRWQGELVHTRRDGSKVVVASRWALERDAEGRPVRVLETNVDVSEQRRIQVELAEQAERLRQSEALMRHVLETLPVGVWILDRQGKSVLTNPSGRHIWAGSHDFGVEWHSDVQGWRIATGQPIQGQEWAAARALSHGESTIGEEIEIECLDGSHKIIINHAVPLRDRAGEITGALVVNEDITDLKRAEEAQRDLAQHLQILHDIDRAILAARSPAEIAQAALHRVREVTGCERASVGIFDPLAGQIHLVAVDADRQTAAPAGMILPLAAYTALTIPKGGDLGLVEELPETPELAAITQVMLAEGLRYVKTLALRAGDHLIGGLSLWSSTVEAFAPENLSFAAQVADSLAVAMQNSKLLEQVQAGRAQLQELSRRLVEVQERERQEISRNLHDEAGQSLTALMLGLGTLERAMAPSATMLAQVRDLKRATEGIMDGLHRLAADLRPATLDKLGLVAGLQQYVSAFARQHGLEVDFEVSGLHAERPQPDVEIAVYRIVQEALTNVARHAHATRVDVGVKCDQGRLIVFVEDNGVGFDPARAAARGRLGILGMQERAETLGGRLSLEGTIGGGTTVLLEIPLGTPDLTPKP